MYESLFDKLRHGPLKVSIIGSGNWASAISKVVGTNAKKNFLFETEVKMWVRDKTKDGQSLSKIINQTHENVQYLKGVRLPENIVAYPDIKDVVNGADLLIFIVPCQFLENVVTTIRDDKQIVIGKHVRAISLTKGFIVKGTQAYVCSQIISDIIKINCCALSGANIARNIADEEFSEATIGGEDKEALMIWQRVFDLPYFKINCIKDVIGIEICGALKNIIAVASGFCDGLNVSCNTKSAIIRIGINELKLFAKLFFNNMNEKVFYESCGFADIITSCLGGRNARCSTEFIKNRQNTTWEQIEQEMLDGQKLQGTVTLKCVYELIEAKGYANQFPLFSVLYRISFKNEDPHNLINSFKTDKVSPILFE